MLTAVGALVFGVAGITGLALLVVEGGTATAAPTCTITFSNTAGGGYFTAANWTDTSSVHRVPTTTDYACIPGSITGSVTLSTGADSTVAGLSAEGVGGFALTSGTLTLTSTTNGSTISGGTLAGGIISGAGALSLTGTTTWKNGELLGPGTVTVASGATLNVTSTGYYSQTAAPVVNNGTITVSNGGYAGFPSTRARA